MRRELELLRREMRTEATRNVSSPATNSNQNVTMRPQIKALAELMSEFAGEEDIFWKWRKQFELIRETYQLDNGSARVLASMRLKQKALQWFHSRPEHLEISVNDLLERMQNIFYHRPGKMELRKQFERRTWRYGETFSHYFYDKVILANKVPVDEDELTDFIMDDMPDGIIRDQGRIQCFKEKEDLLKAFEKVMIR